MTSSLDISTESGRVLIVDDEPHNRQLLEMMLAPEGLQLCAAASGEEAHLIPVHAGHAHVQQDEVERLLPHGGHRNRLRTGSVGDHGRAAARARSRKVVVRRKSRFRSLNERAKSEYESQSEQRPVGSAR